MSALTAGNADKFELSIFAQTPTHVWVGIIGALAISLVLTFFTTQRSKGVVLAVLTVTVLISLPLIRGYYYSGGDALIHLGFAKWILDGGSLTEIYYPAMHLLAITINSIMGLPLRTALMSLTPIFFLLFVGSVSIVVLRMADCNSYHGPLIVGLFVALLIAPVDGITTHLSPHPSSYAILSFPFIIYLVISYYRTFDYRMGLLLPLTYLFVIFLHPQQGLNFAIILAAVAAAQFSIKRLGKTGPVSTQITKWMALQFGIILILDVYYQIGTYKFRRVLTSAVKQFLAMNPGGQAASRASSVNAIGRDFSVFFLKTYGVSLVLSLLAGLFGVLALYRMYRHKATLNDYTTLYLLLAAVPLTLGFILFFVASYEFMYLRYLGPIIVLNSVVAAIGLSRLHEFTEFFTKGPNRILAIFFAILLAISLPTVLPSPYTLSASQNIMEEYYVGYETTYNVKKTDTQIIYTRTLGPRYKSAIEGQPPNIHYTKAPYHFNNQSLSTAYDTDRYLVITSHDRAVDVRLYNEYRYTSEDFAYLRNDPNIYHVISNGEFHLYLVNTERSTG